MKKADLLLELEYTRAELARLQARDQAPARGPSDAAAMFRAVFAKHPEQETFAAAYMDARQRTLKITRISLGTLDRVDVHPREIFRDACRIAAHSILIAHNHPSGNITPSPADIELTSRLCEGGRLLGIPIVDHLILNSCGDFYSFAADHRMP